PVWLEDINCGLSDRFRRLLVGLWEDLRSLDDRIHELDSEIAEILRPIRLPGACNSCVVLVRWWRRR
ncbi:hypothetical protein AB6809_33865, partial [Paraburkholderia sp. RCC_158]